MNDEHEGAISFVLLDGSKIPNRQEQRSKDEQSFLNSLAVRDRLIKEAARQKLNDKKIIRQKRDNEWYDQMWRADFQCYITGVSYDFETRMGTVIMNEGSCCSMSGCVEFFKKIDPQVIHIQAFEGENLDIEYVFFEGDGRFVAIKDGLRD